TSAGAVTYTHFGKIDQAGQDINDPVKIDIGYNAVDGDGDSIMDAFQIKVVGDENDIPVAVSDTDAIISLADTVIQGNVIAGTSENGSGQADDFGNDGPDSGGGVVGVEAGATGGASMTGVGATITGLYGDLVMTATGSYTYSLTSNSIPSGAKDNFTYTIADADGDTSFATLMVDVPQINGLVVGENSNDSGIITNLPIHVIDTVNPGAGGDINGGLGDDLLIGDVGGASQQGVVANYVLIMDTSGSMGGNRIAQLKSAVNNLLNSLPTSGAKDVRVHMVEFNLSANPVGVGTYDIVANGTATAALAAAITAVNSLDANGWTNYEAGFQSAIDLINTNGLLSPTGGEVLENQAFFFSDGAPNRSLNDSSNVINTSATDSVDHVLGIDDSTNELSILDTLLDDDTPGGEIDAIGIELQSNPTALNLLDRLDTQDGDSTNVANASDLNQVLQDLSPLNNIASVGADVINGSGGDDVILGDAPFTDDLASAEGLSTLDGAGWEVIQELINGNGGGISDPANDGAGAWSNEDVLAYVTANAASLARESLSSDGSPRTGGNDIINGGAGNDLIFGMEGNDQIMGGSGNDTQYGGSGADTFKIDELNVNDLIADYESGDFIDLTALFDLPSSGGAPDTSNLSQYVDYDSGSGVLSVDTAGSGNFTDAVTVDMTGPTAPPTVTIVVDDGAGNNASIVV
ncbi:MAG: VWA domain-containing protein, partial [Pseudomonadota bacterium]